MQRTQKHFPQLDFNQACSARANHVLAGETLQNKKLTLRRDVDDVHRHGVLHGNQRVEE